jgi:hypothetical protein
VAYRAKSLGISRCDVRDMATIAPTIARIATVGELVRRISRTSFYIDGCGTLRTVALRRPIF